MWVVSEDSSILSGCILKGTLANSCRPFWSLLNPITFLFDFVVTFMEENWFWSLSKNAENRKKRQNCESQDHSSVRNIPKFKDRANWSHDTFQPMRRRACVYQQTNQNIAPVIKNFQNNGRSRTESVIVSRFSGIFLRFSWGIDNFFKWTVYWKPYWKGLVKYSAHFVAYSSFIF